MNFRYPTFDEWYNEPNDGLASLRSEYLTASKVELLATFNAAREMIEEEDLDQLATLEWVRGRDGWEDCTDSRGYPHAQFRRLFELLCSNPKRVILRAGYDVKNPTRRQVIAAEQFAKEMGWV